MSNVVGAAGVVLAAGAGTRYGSPKVLAEQGRWLERAVSALRDGGCGEVVVVLGAAVVEVPEPARAVIAEDWADGLSASLRAGLGAIDPAGLGAIDPAGLGARAEFAVLHLVDTPDIDGRVVRRVLLAAQAAASGLARAVYTGTPGHPVVIARRHWPQLLGQLTGDTGAGPFLRARPDVVAVECGDLATGADIDVR